jgi:hypothetical protein
MLVKTKDKNKSDACFSHQYMYQAKDNDGQKSTRIVHKLDNDAPLKAGKTRTSCNIASSPASSKLLSLLSN